MRGVLLSTFAIILSVSAIPQETGTPPTNDVGNSSATQRTPSPMNTLSDILFNGNVSVPDECKKLGSDTLQPLFLDPECQLGQFMSSPPSTSSALEPQLNRICSKSCTDKGQAALKAVSALPICGSHPLFGSAVVGAFFHWNHYCIKSNPASTSYCVVDQLKAIEKAKLDSNSSPETWDDSTLCGLCTQKQYKLFKSFKSGGDLVTLSSRPNPGSFEATLRTRCGPEWLAGAEKTDLRYAVKMEQNSPNGKIIKNSECKVAISTCWGIISLVAALASMIA